jgi:hypothetical protein
MSELWIEGFSVAWKSSRFNVQSSRLGSNGDNVGNVEQPPSPARAHLEKNSRGRLFHIAFA